MSDFTDAVHEHTCDLEAFSVGACPGCRECGLSETPTEAERCAADEGSFSWSACESCGSSLGGNRYPAHYLDDNGEISHMHVCTDCLMYHANGDEPEDWSDE